MKQTPILFSAPMVRALLAGTKTQTRREVKNPEYFGCLTGDCPHDTQYECDQAIAGFAVEACPFGQPSDRLWVRENFMVQPLIWAQHHGPQPVHYAADTPAEQAEDYITKPCIYMPRWASRITLEIVSVRVERLHDISEADALAEGCAIDKGNSYHVSGFENVFAHATARGCYETLFESINGPGSWKKNPWVWVIEIKRITTKKL